MNPESGKESHFDKRKQLKKHSADWFDDSKEKGWLEHCLWKIWKNTDPGSASPRTSFDTMLDRIHQQIK